MTPLADRAVEVFGKDYASGFRIGGLLIVTCSHNLDLAQGSKAVEVRLSLEKSKVRAHVVWRNDEADIALLEFCSGIDVEAVEPLSFGTVPKRYPDHAKVDFDMYCFPAFATRETPDEYLASNRWHVSGSISLGTRMADGRLALTPVDTPWPIERNGGSDWAGASGAAVVCGDVVLAVQHEDWNPKVVGAVSATPIGRVASDADWRAQLAKHGVPLELVEIDFGAFEDRIRRVSGMAAAGTSPPIVVPGRSPLVAWSWWGFAFYVTLLAAGVHWREQIEAWNDLVQWHLVIALLGGLGTLYQLARLLWLYRAKPFLVAAGVKKIDRAYVTLQLDGGSSLGCVAVGGSELASLGTGDVGLATLHSGHLLAFAASESNQSSTRTHAGNGGTRGQSWKVTLAQSYIAALLLLATFSYAQTWLEARRVMYDLSRVVVERNAHQAAIVQLAFDVDVDNRYLAAVLTTRADDGTVRQWNVGVESDRPLLGQIGDTYSTGRAVSTNGRWLAQPNGQTVEIVRLDSEPGDRVPLRVAIDSSMAMALGGDLMAVAGVDNGLKLFSMSDSSSQPQELRSVGRVSRLAFDYFGEWLAVASVAQDGREYVEVWTIEGGSPTRKTPPRLYLNGVVHLSISASGSNVFVETYREIQALELDRRLARIFRTRRMIDWPSSASFGFRESSRGANLFAAAGPWGRSSVSVWGQDPDSSTDGYWKPRPIVGTVGQVSHLSFSPNGEWLAAASDTGVHLWRVRADSVLGRPHTISGPGRSFSVVAFSWRGEWLAAGAEDGSLFIWPCPGCGD